MLPVGYLIPSHDRDTVRAPHGHHTDIGSGRDLSLGPLHVPTATMHHRQVSSLALMRFDQHHAVLLITMKSSVSVSGVRVCFRVCCLFSFSSLSVRATQLFHHSTSQLRYSLLVSAPPLIRFTSRRWVVVVCVCGGVYVWCVCVSVCVVCVEEERLIGTSGCWFPPK